MVVQNAAAPAGSSRAVGRAASGSIAFRTDRGASVRGRAHRFGSPMRFGFPPAAPSSRADRCPRRCARLPRSGAGCRRRVESAPPEPSPNCRQWEEALDQELVIAFCSGAARIEPVPSRGDLQDARFRARLRPVCDIVRRPSAPGARTDADGDAVRTGPVATRRPRTPRQRGRRSVLCPFASPFATDRE